MLGGVLGKNVKFDVPGSEQKFLDRTRFGGFLFVLILVAFYDLFLHYFWFDFIFFELI